MDWQDYYQKQSRQSDKQIEEKAKVKRDELSRAIFGYQVGFGLTPVKIAVLGCGDIRMMEWHRKIFGELLGHDLKIITFDIDTEHLRGEQNVIKHNCIDPLPKGPFDIVYSSILLKFLKPEDQWQAIWKSYEAILPGGRAIHILNKTDYTDTGEVKDDDTYLVLLDEWMQRLYDSKVKYDEVDIHHGVALVIYKE